MNVVLATLVVLVFLAAVGYGAIRVDRSRAAPRVLARHGTRHGAEPQPPASAAEVADLEERLGLRLPPALVELLRERNGHRAAGLTAYGTRDAPLTGDPGQVLPGVAEAGERWHELFPTLLVLAETPSAVYGWARAADEWQVRDRTDGTLLRVPEAFPELVAAAVRAVR